MNRAFYGFAIAIVVLAGAVYYAGLSDTFQVFSKLLLWE